MRTLNLRTLSFDDRSEAGRRLRVEVEPFRFGGADYTVESGGVDLELSASRVGSRVSLRGEAVATVRGPCQRCLEDAAVEVALAAEDHVFAGSSEGMEGEDVYVTGDVLELDRWVRDALADALPVQLLCRPDCKGLCAVCGADLNTAHADHGHEAV